MTIRGSACPRCFSRSLSPVSFSLVQQLTSAATQSTEMHRRPRGTSVGECGPWVREHTRPWAPWTATRERPTADSRGRPAAPAPRGRGRVAEECRRRHVARHAKRPRFFLCPWWQRSKRRGVAAGSRGAPQRACALLSCDAHCVCVPGAGLRTARTGQQGLAGLAEARLHRCLRRKSRLVVTGAQGSGRGGVQCELRRSLARAACTPRTVAGAPV